MLIFGKVVSVSKVDIKTVLQDTRQSPYLVLSSRDLLL